jgi:hypothetical protein
MPAYYARTIGEFLSESDTSILGTLAQANAEAKFLQLESAAIEAWRSQFEIMRGALSTITQSLSGSAGWGFLLEFPIPRRQRRIDLALLARDVVFVIEFKTAKPDKGAFRQVEDYALDLADFHAPSRTAVLVPIVVAPGASNQTSDPSRGSGSCVKRVQACEPSNLADRLQLDFSLYTSGTSAQIELNSWNNGAYRPVPSIVEAAMAIFSGMEVREIAHAHTDAHNLTSTVDSIFDAIEKAKRDGRKSICFVTGVPGSGKSLAGLRAVHDSRIKEKLGTDPNFLSGNGPLVKILREALIRDFVRRKGQSKHKARREVETLIQNIHAFAKYYWEECPTSQPHEKIIVFDEAQRAWSAKKNKRKFGRDISEPSMILTIMDRHPDWAVVVALVGGGQEIHDGEAGLAEWGRTLSAGFRHWRVLASPEALEGGPSVAGSRLFEGDTSGGLEIVPTPVLHLKISTRSYRAVAITEWSNEILRGNVDEALRALAEVEQFPVVVTRDLAKAKDWLRNQTRGMARCGLVASSGATRLRAYGFETSTGFHRDYPYEYWFLNGPEDVRSSFQLEVVATEFEIQGLELDWVGLCWGGDLEWDSQSGNWNTRRFVGTAWKSIKVPLNRDYVLNSYRVLLTRARQGMVIWVPPGDNSDPTLDPTGLDVTANILIKSGLKALE